MLHRNSVEINALQYSAEFGCSSDIRNDVYFEVNHRGTQQSIQVQYFFLHNLFFLKLSDQKNADSSPSMVKIAIAGGTGSTFLPPYTIWTAPNIFTDVGQEIVDVLTASKKHEILIFTRKVSIHLCHFCQKMLMSPSGRPSWDYGFVR